MLEKVLVLDPSRKLPSDLRKKFSKSQFAGVDPQIPKDQAVVLVYLESSRDLDRIESLRLMEPQHQSSWVAIFSGGNWSPELLVNKCNFHQILNIEAGWEEILKSLEESERFYREKQEYTEALKNFKTQNRLLEQGQQNLKLKVGERTESLSKSKQELEEKVSYVRDLIRFIQDLASALSVEDLFTLLRREIRGFHSVGAPIMYYHLNISQGHLLYSQSQAVLSKTVTWESPSHMRIRVNEIKDSKRLANILSRPVGKVIAFPFAFRQSRALAEIFFEHQLGTELDEFLEFISERLQAFSIALDRILLDIDLRKASSQWEKTFDGLDQPLAILDSELRVLRHNRHFSESLLPQLDSEKERWKKALSRNPMEKLSWKQDKTLYEIDFYPIHMQSSERPDHVICYYTDVTQERELQTQVIQGEKMAALGHLAGHIAHELNNPLTGIRSLSQILLTEVEADSQVSKDLHEVEKACERSQKIITNLLQFSHAGEALHLQSVDLNEVVDRSLSLLKTVMGHYERHIELQANPLWVRGDAHLLQQIFFNLIHNACQAMESSGTLIIGTTRQGSEACFWVADSGKGIPQDIQAQIFEPFFTTKEKGQGTGLGLNMSRKLVRKMKGRIELESEVGKGSTFRVYIPLEESGENTYSG